MTKEECLESYLPVFQAALNYWAALLKPAEVLTLLYINDRTLRYGKEWEHVKFSHYTKGLPAKSSAKVIHCGIGISQTTLQRALKTLQEADLIHAENTQQSGRYYMGNLYRVNILKVTLPLAHQRYPDA